MNVSIPTTGSTHQFREYRIYGMSVLSEIPLGFPERQGGRSPDVTFFLAPRNWFAEVTAGVPRDESTNGSYERLRSADGAEFLRWPGLFAFMVSHDGRFVVCDPLEQATVESLRTHLLGQVLSFALVKQGHEPLHATTVVIDGKAVAFLGDSGYGKSTLAAAFLHAGHQMLTDDLLLIGTVDGTFCGFPGPPRIKLFPDVVEQFLPSQGSCAQMSPETEKLIVPLEHHQVHADPAPLHAFFVLEEPEQGASSFSLALLTGTRSLLQLVRSTFNARVAGPDRLHRQFLAVREWAARIPVRCLTYPRTVATLAHVRQAIVSDVRSVGNVVS